MTDDASNDDGAYTRSLCRTIQVQDKSLMRISASLARGSGAGPTREVVFPLEWMVLSAGIGEGKKGDFQKYLALLAHLIY